MSEQQSFYDAVGGADTFHRLVAAFYRGVAADPELRALYPEEDLGPAEVRFRMFLEQYWGGPTTYSEQRGHPRLRMRHGRFTIDQAARDRWVSLMEAALEESDLPQSVRPTLRRFFHDAATFLINRESPRARSGEAGA